MTTELSEQEKAVRDGVIVRVPGRAFGVGVRCEVCGWEGTRANVGAHLRSRRHLGVLLERALDLGEALRVAEQMEREREVLRRRKRRAASSRT